MLFARAMSIVGKQVGPLCLAYWMICEWNPSHYLVTCSCRRETFGLLAYPCEGTKAFARCFPLLAISVSLVVTGRFILQSRIYYLLLSPDTPGRKTAILNFQNYKVYKDPAVFLLGCCFLIGCLHFGFHVFFPPYLVNNLDKVSNIGQFILPCVVFFVIFESGCNIEKHLVTLNRFYEDDPVKAKEHLDGVKVLDEKKVHRCSKEACKSDGDGELALDTLLDDIVRRADLDDDESDAKRAGLFEGLWPGQVLLGHGLNDPVSKRFQCSVRVFMSIFAVTHAVLLGLLCSSTIREFGDTLPRKYKNWRPTNAIQLGGVYYTELGPGYCRDESMQRPDCYWVTWDKAAQGGLPTNHSHAPVETASLQKPRRAILQKPKLLNSRRNRHGKYYHPAMVPDDGARRQTMFLSASTNATARGTRAPAVDELPEWMKPQTSGEFEQGQIDFCGKACSSNKKCIGFSLDPEYCTVYNSLYVKAPSGWENSAEAETKSSELRRRYVVQGSRFELATCWGTVNQKGEPQDVVGAIVTLLHVGGIIVILFRTLGHTHMGPRLEDLTGFRMPWYSAH